MSRRKHAADFFAILDQEEYVWAMQTAAYEEKLQIETESIQELSISRERATPDVLLSKKTTTLASFLPDLIILNVDDYASKSMDACILCGDVSGFTELCETYNQTGSGGPTRLTEVLNNFIGAMVQEIISHGGDVIKFSGDAFLALWKCSQEYSMRDDIQEAINCALVIQKTHNNFITDVGVTLRVKLAISSGTLHFSLIGDSQLSHYIEVGQPILDIKDILELCYAGDILISEKTYAYVDTSAYLIETVAGSKYLRIFGVGAGWRQVQKFSTSQNANNLRNTEETNSDDSLNSTETIERKRNSSEYALRPVVTEATNNAYEIYEHLKKFIIPPVMKRIELNEPLEYLTELRQITVIMINILPQKITFDSLISLARRVYRIITTHILKFSGCINKVSFFDKDLMCVVIFGLRGLKQELECQNALKCASLIHDDIYVLSKVKSVSIGVSTGKTYCGVFGHTLRREYTVIGLTVNKAARLMVAYPHKVTCCNETFINSKLDETYFERQQYIYLKGIKNPGPVYEFKNTVFDTNKKLTISKYPILGRDEEIAVYDNLVRNFLKKENDYGDVPIKMFILEGEAKSGKTRLLEEFIRRTPPEIPVQIIFAENSVLEPYNVLKQMFFPAMGIPTRASQHSREKILQDFLKGYNQKDIPILNDIFNVRFYQPDGNSSLSDDQKICVIGKILQYLSSLVFTSPKIFIIEKMQLMEDMTWQIFAYLLEIDNLFIIGTMRLSRESSIDAPSWTSTSRKVQFMKLKTIDKIYYSALACQMLEVEAIPPDLENAIQSQSHGNPGWIKNLLICLRQSEEILIYSSSYEEIYKTGLVAPPLYMMKRLNPKQLEEWKRSMEESSGLRNRDIVDPWFKYVDSCRDEYTDTTVREDMKENSNYIQEVKACIMAPGFGGFTKHYELSKEILIIKTFDSLSYSEQLVAKCGSVLGWQFPRSILEYVVGSSCSKRKKAEAIQSLFENRIFGCSRGDFTEAGEYVLFRNTRHSIDYENQPIECNCIGLNIPDCCDDLPKYASCGYLHFVSQNFLQATYNLLPEMQKNEIHQRAAKYFEKNTRKCRACGNGFFEEFTGNMVKVLRITKGAKKSILSHSSLDEETISRSVHSDTESVIAGSILSTELSAVGVDYGFESTRLMNRRRLLALKARQSLTRTFSMYDFSSCECKLILNFMYGEIARHYRVAGQFDKMLKSMLAYSKSCINLENEAEAFITLELAEKHLQIWAVNSKKPKWKIHLLQGNIFALRGMALLQTNQIDNAQTNLLKAMKEYGAPFPKTNFVRYIRRHNLSLRQKFALYLLPNSLTSRQLKQYEMIYFNDLAECLYLLSRAFMTKNLIQELKLSAVWALHCALKADYDLQVICRCFTDMLTLAMKENNHFHSLALEIHALRYCHHKKSAIESDDLKYVAELYIRIRNLRYIRSELEKSIYIGYISLRLAVSVKNISLVLLVIPRLVHSLTLKSYLSEACSIIRELDYYSSETECKSTESGRLYYHIMCLKFHLETGYTVVPYEESEKFIYTENLELAAVKTPNAQLEFVTLMWLWNCRRERWEYAEKWKNVVYTFAKEHSETPNPTTTIPLFVLEGLLLSLVNLMNSQSIKNLVTLKTLIDKLFNRMKTNTKFCKLLIPRLKHFEAYYQYIKGNEDRARKMLETTQIYAAELENALELIHINHSKLAWKNHLSYSNKKSWVDYCDRHNYLDFRLLETLDYKVVSYILPKPIYD